MLFVWSLVNGKRPALVMVKLSGCFHEKVLDINPSSEVEFVGLSGSTQ